MTENIEAPVPLSPVKSSLAARVDSVIQEMESGGGASEAAAEPSSEASPPPAEGAETAVASEATPEQIETARAKEARLAEIEAKLAEARDRRAAAVEGKRAKAAREQAEADRKAAAEERAALAEGRKDFRKFFAANGMDGRQAYEEMTRQAIEAGTPEAQLRRLQEDFRTELSKEVERLRETEVAPLRQVVEHLNAERERLAAEAESGRLVSAFQAEVRDPEFVNLLTEYDEDGVFGYVEHFVNNPQAFHAAAREHNVRLTNPTKGFTMREILTVLKSAQDRHDEARQQRAARFAPAAPSAKTPTVNGTAPRGNAGTTIGNDVSSERASPGRRLTRTERINAEIERLERR